MQTALGGSHLQSGAANLLIIQRAMGTDADAAKYAPEGAAVKKVIAELPRSKWTTSLQISVKHEPGSLFRCIEAFNDLGINMTRINSRVPRSDSPYTLTIYVDYEGDSRDEASRKLLERLQCCSEFVSTTASWEMPWIPRKIADLDQFASKYCGSALGKLCCEPGCSFPLPWLSAGVASLLLSPAPTIATLALAMPLNCTNDEPPRLLMHCPSVLAPTSNRPPLCLLSLSIIRLPLQPPPWTPAMPWRATTPASPMPSTARAGT